MAVKRALIVGGGIAGLSAALALDQAGIAADVIELRTDRQVCPGGIVVHDTFLTAMERLGVLEAVLRAGFAYRGVRLLDLEGYVFDEIVGPPGARPSHLSLTRPALMQILSARAHAAGVSVRRPVTFIDMKETPDGVDVTFTDGTRGRYDLVVGADGKASRMRHMMFGPVHRPQFTGQGVWRSIVLRPKGLDWAEMYLGKGDDRAGYIPLTAASMCVFAVTAEPGNPKFCAEELAYQFRQRLEGYGGLLADLRDNEIGTGARVLYHPLEACTLPAPWHKGRMVLIGDAAHCVTSHLAQGASLAVADAVALGAALGAHADLPDALAAFMAQRRADTVRPMVTSLALATHASRPADLERHVVRLKTAAERATALL